MKMWDNGRRFKFWEVLKGIYGILEFGFGLGGNLEMVQV